MNTIIRLPQVKKRTGLSKSSIYSFISFGTFPKPISLGIRSIGWVENDISEWIENRIAESRKDNENVSHG